MRRSVPRALRLLAIMTILTGIVYPLLMTGIGHLFFPGKSEGSIVSGRDGNTVGSQLIGQYFTDPKYFFGRPSATSPFPYNAAASGGSNLSPSGEKQKDIVRMRIEEIRSLDPGNTEPVPVELVTASASGLDPHISPEAALYQVPRIARMRGMDPEVLVSLVAKHTEERLFGFLGEKRVNVLLLNIDLDTMDTGNQVETHE